jgi:hypothetical protein
LAEPKDGASRKSSQKLQFGDQKLAAGDILKGIREAKMEILAKMEIPVETFRHTYSANVKSAVE